MKDSSLDDFNNSMRANKEDDVTVVLFYSSWLPENASKNLLDNFDAISSRFVGTKFLQYSVNKQTHIPMSLGVKAVPAIFTFRGNSVFDCKYGFMTAERIIELVENTIANTDDDEF
jgi:thioredoxin-like negative regulator of GroEL